MIRFQYLVFVLFAMVLACEDPAPPPTAPPLPVQRNQPDEQVTSGASGTGQKDCQVAGLLLDENRVSIPGRFALAVIVADSTTRDPEFGDSHRIFRVYDTRTCEPRYEETLPINFSPDYPYYLEAPFKAGGSQLICTQGFHAIYCYDLSRKQALTPLKPKFSEDQEGVDGQSGSPAGMKQLGDYLFSYAIDWGPYAYDLSDPAAPKWVAPDAAFPLIDQEDLSLLYLMEEAAGQYQAVIPVLNEDATGFELRSLFEAPRSINPAIARQVRNNRYIVLSGTAGQPSVAIDMKAQEKVALPEDVASQSTSAILRWIKSND